MEIIYQRQESVNKIYSLTHLRISSFIKKYYILNTKERLTNRIHVEMLLLAENVVEMWQNISMSSHQVKSLLELTPFLNANSTSLVPWHLANMKFMSTHARCNKIIASCFFYEFVIVLHFPLTRPVNINNLLSRS